jgi:hypothetical protein
MPSSCAAEAAWSHDEDASEASSFWLSSWEPCL